MKQCLPPLRALLCGVLLCLSGGAQAQLKNDPFARPVLRPGAAQSAAPAPTPAPAPDNGQRPSASKSTDAQWNPELTAVMSAGRESVVKVGGVFVRVGDVFEGHRLTEVRESQAVFIAVQGKRRVVLSLGGRESPTGLAPVEDARTIERRDDSRERQEK
jgi:hypothetical protein